MYAFLPEFCGTTDSIVCTFETGMFFILNLRMYTLRPTLSTIPRGHAECTARLKSIIHSRP